MNQFEPKMDNLQNLQSQLKQKVIMKSTHCNTFTKILHKIGIRTYRKPQTYKSYIKNCHCTKRYNYIPRTFICI